MRKPMMMLATAILTLALAAPIASRADDVMVKGEVTKVDEAAGKITIQHDAIKKFDMDAMTMVFRAADPAMLKQVKAGDKVKFHPDKVNGQFTITKIEKTK